MPKALFFVLAKSCFLAVILGPITFGSIATAGSHYALLDRSNNIVLQQDFDDHPPVPSGGLKWVPLSLNLTVPNEHQFESSRTYYFGPDKVVISNTIDEKSK
jgi:hypothetical protein